MWGSDQAQKCIEVNGQTKTVRSNLYGFLLQARDLYPTQDLWIDATCIDQENIKERNHQVGIMGEIYRNASMVLVWLGQNNTWANAWIPTLFSYIRQSRSLIELARPEHLPMLIDAVIAICNLEYWSRTWIVQELLLANDVRVVYRNHQIEWDILWRGIDMTKQVEPSKWVLERAWKSVAGSFAVRHHEARTRRTLSIIEDPFMEVKYHFPELLARYADTKCTDPRDRLYAFLSLIEQGDQIVVDYGMSTTMLMDQGGKYYCGCHSCPRHQSTFLRRTLGMPHPLALLPHEGWDQYLAGIPQFCPGNNDMSAIKRSVITSIRVRLLLRPCHCIENPGRETRNRPGKVNLVLGKPLRIDDPDAVSTSPEQNLGLLTFTMRGEDTSLWENVGTSRHIITFLDRVSDLDLQWEHEVSSIDVENWRSDVRFLLQSDPDQCGPRFKEIHRHQCNRATIEVTPFLDLDSDDIRKAALSITRDIDCLLEWQLPNIASTVKKDLRPSSSASEQAAAIEQASSLVIQNWYAWRNGSNEFSTVEGRVRSLFKLR